MRAYKANMIPGGTTPVINVSQYDNDYAVTVTLIEGADIYTPPVGATIRVEGTKPDGNGFEYPCTYQGNVVTMPIYTQMTAVAGRFPIELVVYQSGLRVGSCNIIFAVEKAPLGEDTDISETVIPDIIAGAQAQADAAAASATAAASSAASAETAKDAAMDAAQAAAQSAASLTVDTELSSTSTNPVQNKVIDATVTELKNELEPLVDSFTIALTLNDGYITESGAIISPTKYNEKYSNIIGCIPSQPFTITVKLNSANGLRLDIAEYDKDGVFIRKTGITPVWSAEYSETYIVPSGVYGFIVMFRSYSGGSISVECDNWAYLLTNLTAPNGDVVRDFHPDNSAYATSVRGIGHMGYYSAPENTIPAHEQAKVNGFAFAECDIRLTSDNIPVLCHDETINRTARNADGTTISDSIYVSNSTYQSLLQYDFGIYKGAAYEGTKIATLDDVLKFAKMYDMSMYLELKGIYTPAIIQAYIYPVVTKYHMQERVTWVSSSFNYLSYLKEIDRYARLGAIVQDITSETITNCNNLYTDHNSIFITAAYDQLTTEGLNRAIEAHIPVEVYTVNDLDVMLGLDGYIDGVSSDKFNYPQELMNLLT